MGSTADGFSEVIQVDEQRLVLPIVEFEVRPQLTAAFYVWPDLSAGYSLSYGGVSRLLPEDELAGISIAEVFWALSPKSMQVPEALMLHHDAMVVDNGRPQWETSIDELPQGWITQRPGERALSACTSFNFYTNHCKLYPPYSASFCRYLSGRPPPRLQLTWRGARG